MPLSAIKRKTPSQVDFQIDDNLWDLFAEFFREEKGHSDWTDEEIELSRNNDDIIEFIQWLSEREFDKPITVGLSKEIQ